jgi:creatinine amidohydrolase
MIFGNESYQTLRKASGKIVVVPLGAIEQHGPQLSVGTDTLIVTAIAQAVEAKRSDDIILASTLPFGSSHHHLHFGGTISLSPLLYTNVIVDIVSTLIEDGFRKIILLNGHGGNITPVKQALSVISRKLDKDCQPNVVLATYWEVAGSPFAGEPPMESPALSHACEYETSMMLFLHADKVFPEAIKRAKRPVQNNYVGWEDDVPYRGISIVKQTEFISDNGSSGEPQLATADKGRHLFDTAVGALVEFIDSFKEWPLMKKLN